jgi:pimeloyl-ACP methyl ester carboxylesterase
MTPHTTRISGLSSRRAILAWMGALGSWAGLSGSAVGSNSKREPHQSASTSPVGRKRMKDIGLEHLVVRHRHTTVQGLDIFYREAGHVDAPAVLLLHGFPASSHMFRHLIPALADGYRVVAPDYPGFGYSALPAGARQARSFASITELTAAFTDTVGLSRYTLYIQDYGAPIGLRLALLRPQRVAALIVQNGNAYEEGLSDAWAPLKAYWTEPTPARRERLRAWLDEPGTRLQYVAGLPEAELNRFAPDTWTLDWHVLSRPESIERQLDLFGDYRTNVALYPAFQEFLRTWRPPTLVVWGANDPFFTVEGAQAYRRDLADAEIHLLEGVGHFALESHGPQVIELIREFLQRRIG